MNIKPKYKQQIYIQIKIEYKLGWCILTFGCISFIYLRGYIEVHSSSSSINIKLYGKKRSNKTTVIKIHWSRGMAEKELLNV